jgi:hypothetical protein
MPDGVYRYLSCKSEPTLIEAAMVCFVSPRLEEPALILARLKYQDTEAGLRTVCKEWDLWYLFFDWNQGWEDGKPMNCSVPTPDNDRIQWVRAVHVPLYSVTSMDMIRDYLERLRSHSAGA